VGTNHISGTAEDRVIKFCKPVGYINSQYTEDESPLKERDHGHVSQFLIWGPQWYLWNG